MKTGILALQGSFHEHSESLKLIDKDYIFIRSIKDLNKIDSIIFPGGESTAMMKIQENENLFLNLKELIESGIPTLGTCAGLIILSNQSVEGNRPLGVIDCLIERNGYGRQNQSFEATVTFDNFTGEYCFIRAPKIISYGSVVEPIAFFGDETVGIRQNNIVGLSFHPELTNDEHYINWLKVFLKKGFHVGTL